jgi:hypothetical protein
LKRTSKSSQNLSTTSEIAAQNHQSETQLHTSPNNTKVEF